MNVWEEIFVHAFKSEKGSVWWIAACDDCHLYVFRKCDRDKYIIFIGGSVLFCGCRIQRVRSDDWTCFLSFRNSCSQVRYPDRFVGDLREVELEGEGYFRVARNEKMPFVVRTKRLDVQVLGTRFDVKSYSTDEIVSVSVESGKVQVDLPEAMMRLTAKEQVLINTVSGEYSKKTEDRGVAVWMKGGLRFYSTPIRDVAKELERVYNCRITFAPGQDFNNLITGEHDNKSLEAVLKSIEFISGDIKYKKEGINVLLYKE